MAADLECAESYMLNMSEEEQKLADIVLAPMEDENEETTEQNEQSDWQLPCHSIILSAVSSAFAAGKQHSTSMHTEKNSNGKRVVRVPLDREAADIFLQYCYGVLSDPKALAVEDAFQLADVGHMYNMAGTSTQKHSG